MSEALGETGTADKLARLGYAPDARLLIVNGDDLGMCHAANSGTFRAMEGGIVTSASLMIPCPWSYDACTYLNARPHLDVGVHLTFTSEWASYRWGPVLDAARCPSLVDRWGFFPPLEQDVYERAALDEVQAEAEAQIRRAIDWGVSPTNLDGHMSTLYAHPDYLAVYVGLARRYRLPLRLAPRHTYAKRGAAAVYDALPLHDVVTNDDLRFVALDHPDALRDELVVTLRSLQPGMTELCLHASADTPEARAIMPDVAARIEALHLMTDPAIRDEIERLGIVLIGWRDLHPLLPNTGDL